MGFGCCNFFVAIVLVVVMLAKIVPFLNKRLVYDDPLKLPIVGGRGGGAGDGLGADPVISGPMRGPKINCIERGHTYTHTNGHGDYGTKSAMGTMQ